MAVSSTNRIIRIAVFPVTGQLELGKVPTHMT